MGISIYELMEIVNPKIIDVRSANSYLLGHIPGARNIYFQSLIAKPSDFLSKDELYYIYCSKGLTSNMVCLELSKRGYNVMNVIGGYDMWKKYNEQ